MMNSNAKWAKILRVEFIIKFFKFKMSENFVQILRYDKAKNYIENHITANIKWLDDKILTACESCIKL